MDEETQPTQARPPSPADVARRRFQRSSAAEQVRSAEFPAALRGYDREAVDRYVEDVTRMVAELESRQTRDEVVQRALSDVGEQTAGILQRAHEAAEEITARARAEAEGTLQRAQAEAEATRRDAEAFAERLVIETRRLWADRQRLIEDVRALADQVLATADEAAERVAPPREVTEPEPATEVEQPTVEVEAPAQAEGEPRPE
jgi:DivIVA domain-containing protein